MWLIDCGRVALLCLCACCHQCPYVLCVCHRALAQWCAQTIWLMVFTLCNILGLLHHPLLPFTCMCVSGIQVVVWHKKGVAALWSSCALSLKPLLLLGLWKCHRSCGVSEINLMYGRVMLLSLMVSLLTLIVLQTWWSLHLCAHAKFWIVMFVSMFTLLSVLKAPTTDHDNLHLHSSWATNLP